MYKLKAKFYAVNLSSAHQLSPLCRTAAKNLRTSHHLTSGLWTSLSSLHYSTTLCQGLWRKPLNYLSYLRCPKLYCPVKRRGDKKMWEVYRSNCCMAVDTCDWSLVSFKHLTDSSFAVSEYTTKVNYLETKHLQTEIALKYNLNTATRRFCCLIWMSPHCKRLHHSRITEDQAWKQTFSSPRIFY